MSNVLVKADHKVKLSPAALNTRPISCQLSWLHLHVQLASSKMGGLSVLYFCESLLLLLSLPWLFMYAHEREGRCSLTTSGFALPRGQIEGQEAPRTELYRQFFFFHFKCVVAQYGSAFPPKSSIQSVFVYPSPLAAVVLVLCCLHYSPLTVYNSYIVSVMSPVGFWIRSFETQW